jgi:hypothetical protein
LLLLCGRKLIFSESIVSVKNNPTLVAEMRVIKNVSPKVKLKKEHLICNNKIVF